MKMSREEFLKSAKQMVPSGFFEAWKIVQEDRVEKAISNIGENLTFIQALNYEKDLFERIEKHLAEEKIIKDKVGSND